MVRESQVSWKDCIGNPYLVALSPEMIKAPGAIRRRCIKIPHQRSHVDLPKQIDIHYDREFVIAKIRHLLIEPLALQPDEYNELISLVAAAWRNYQGERYSSQLEGKQRDRK